MRLNRPGELSGGFDKGNRRGNSSSEYVSGLSRNVNTFAHTRYTLILCSGFMITMINFKSYYRVEVKPTG